MNDHLTLDPLSPAGKSLISTAEEAVSALVKRVKNEITPDKVAEIIGEHTKAIVSQTAMQTRQSLNKLFDVLQDMDHFIQENEERLRSEIDRHVKISNSAGRSANIIQETVEEWQNTLEFKLPERK